MKMTEEQVARLLVNVLQEIRKEIDPEMPVQQLLTYLVAVRQPGIPMQDAMTELNISSASISRNVAALGRINRHHDKGHDLIDAQEDPMERRRKVLSPTPTGQRLLARLTWIINKQLAREG
jgi:DNA-binding MarR family transcriptional regulator